MIAAIGSLGLSSPVQTNASSGSFTFGKALSQALSTLNQMENAGQQAMINVAAGKGTLEQAVVATDQANLALDLTNEVRNRAIQAYQSLWSLQT